MKKILSFLLALALLIGIIPMSFAGAATLTDAVKSNYSIETTLSDGIIQKTAKRTFFVIAKDGDGAITSIDALLVFRKAMGIE